jgi:hypothetical protein
MSALQPCPNCQYEDCCGDNPFTFSLVAGQVYANDQIAIDFQCPPGFRCIPGVYLIPKGQFTLVVPSNEASTLRMQCCQSELVQQIQAGATAEQIGVIAQNMVNACALQQANCNAQSFVNYRNTYRNAEVCDNGCGNQGIPGLVVGWIGAPPNLPPAIYFKEGSLCLREAVFVGQVSQSAVDASATTFLQNYVTSLLFQGVLDCGWWNEEQTCPDSEPPVVIPAFTYFSTVSQEQANQDALDAECPSSCCVEPLNSIGPLGFPNFLTYDPTNDLVFVACQTEGVKAIDPSTDAVVGTRFTGGTTYWGGLVYVPLTDRVYCCVQIGATASWQIIHPLTMALIGTITPPGGYTFLTNLQPTYDPIGERIIVAGRRTAGFLPALLQIDVNTAVCTLAYLESNSFNGMEFPGAYDSTRNRFIYKIGDFAGGVDNLVIFNSAFGVVGTVSLGSAGVSGNTGDVLYVEEVDKVFFSGTTSAGDRFLQLNADTLATEFTIGNTRGSIWFNSECGIVFQNNGTTVAQWDYSAEESKCTPASPGFGLGATTETATSKSYIVVQGAAGTVNSLQAV